MALKPYSVSPRRNDHSRGPNPTKNSSTLIPNHLAVTKWPASCARIIRNTPKTNRRMPIQPGMLGDQLGGPATSPAVGPLQRHHRDHGGGLVLVQGHGHDLGDAGQRHPPVEERHDGNL